MKTKRLPSIFIICLVTFGLASCGSEMSVGSDSMICASIAGYQSTTALALVDAAQGGSARDYVETLVGGYEDVIGSNSSTVAIFESYLNAMKDWATAVDIYQLDGQSANLTDASKTLENEIDLLVPQCESKGWDFESGWRS